ncbi:MAG: site-specific DNA-methyltransferase [Clostridium sp.]|uniref:site-specific DNA-methyltransferase n=1 Tax=Clostridium sp. TaxID=1506 RepID=UPI003D6D7519
MDNKQKLELTWIGKGNEPKLEPRILLYDKDKSYGDESSENMLIHGDNLLALKGLEQDYAGKVKCIYIDPPYNTGSAFEHYDDNLEHSTWLNLMKPRLEMLRNLLSDNGSIWISIDDDEQAYLKVLCDEVFGRKNFVNNVIWEKKYSPQNDAKWLSDSHDFIMVYAKNKEIWRPNLLPRSPEMDARYKNLDNDPRGDWKSSDLSVKTYTATCDYSITTPSGRVVNPPPSRCWRTTKKRFDELVVDNRVWFGINGNNVPSIKRFLTEVKQGSVSKTIWSRTEVGDNQEARKDIIPFNSENVFATPKPERLLERILTLGTNEGDLVLDSFLGSGTTAAVAHKMNRKYIGIELGEHCYTHCIPRLEKVIDGTDQGGISKAINWKGGGGIKFYELAPSLLKKDKYNNWIFDMENYNADMLATAMAKLSGYKYCPDENVFWKQGEAHEGSYIFTTTQYITTTYVNQLTEEMKNGENLLICCPAFDIGLDGRYENIIIKKIPQAVLNKCDFGISNYNMNIIDISKFDSEVDFDE